jgi:D-alanine-D-alanine ligase
MGGKSPEHEISLASGRAVLENISRERYRVLPIIISRKGRWLTKRTRNTTATMQKLLSWVDVAVIMLHGPYGEDGTIQGLLEMFDIPYTGAGVLASSLAMDKIKTKEIMKANGVLIADYMSLDREGWLESKEKFLSLAVEKIGFPCVVKPSNLGSSVGISISKDRKTLAESCLKAFKYSDKILIEDYIKGREIHCGVLGNKNPSALPLDEVKPKNEFYDYEAKYKEGMSDHEVPARLPKKLIEKVQREALKIYKLLCCQGMARIDFFIQGEKVIFNELNTIPGFTQTSIFPKEAKVAGINFSNLIDRLINLAVSRERSGNR